MSEPWRSWLAAAVIRFGLSPAQFWALTLAEWRTLANAGGAGRPMTRGELDSLIKAHGGQTDDTPIR